EELRAPLKEKDSPKDRSKSRPPARSSEPARSRRSAPPVLVERRARPTLSEAAPPARRPAPVNLTPPRIPRQRRAFSTVGGEVESAGEPEAAQALTKLWNVDAGLARALT